MMAKTVSSREATIGRSARVRGRISGDGDLLVEGVVEGDIALGGDLTVADGGSVQTVEARTVTVRGEVSGDIRASGEVHIETGSRVRGDVQGSTVAIDEGAVFAGRLDVEFDMPPELGGGATTGRRR
ncbi:MAG: polymer-forming cytoskeletal protein [Myxococcales bacterium]|nr:polymer-forming cytoskeletal protein [Myxococcales bacterium]